jgi:hypothetical protein
LGGFLRRPTVRADIKKKRNFGNGNGAGNREKQA